MCDIQIIIHFSRNRICDLKYSTIDLEDIDTIADIQQSLNNGFTDALMCAGKLSIQLICYRYITTKLVTELHIRDRQKRCFLQVGLMEEVTPVVETAEHHSSGPSMMRAGGCVRSL